ncbi:hypothetical protein [Nocardiopsis baichengensis]|uniref:hypothetical protein n=1 Tax=Nocardiopsis baichengensis TaxID=280240 RepID=UPI001268B315|nr:hypothetical protein [Nocardiopsis baichengensis]
MNPHLDENLQYHAEKYLENLFGGSTAAVMARCGNLHPIQGLCATISAMPLTQFEPLADDEDPTINDYYRPIRSTRLHIDELERLLAFLKQNTESMKIAAGNVYRKKNKRKDRPAYWLTTPDALALMKRRDRKHVWIFTENPKLEIRLGDSLAYIKTNDTSPQVHDIADRFHELVSYRHPKMANLWHFGFKRWMLILSSAIVASFLIVSGGEFTSHAHIRNTLTVPVATIGFIYILTAFATRFTGRAPISSRRSKWLSTIIATILLPPAIEWVYDKLNWVIDVLSKLFSVNPSPRINGSR